MPNRGEAVGVDLGNWTYAEVFWNLTRMLRGGWKGLVSGAVVFELEISCYYLVSSSEGVWRGWKDVKLV